MSTATSPRIHPTAIVDPGAQLGANVEVGPYSVVEAGARIGDGCVLGAAVHVFGCVELGAGSSVRTGAVLGGEPQDVKYKGEASRVVIGARCRIHEHVTVHRGTGAGTLTSIGDDVMLMAGSHVGHNCRVERNVVLVNGAMLAGHVHVGERAFLSGSTAVHQFCSVGRLTMLGGGCMLSVDAPPFSIVTGVHPARWRALNTVGLRRAGFDSDKRAALRHALVALFRSGESPRHVAEELFQSPVPEVVELARFVLDSKRGVCTGKRGRTSHDDGDTF